MEVEFQQQQATRVRASLACEATTCEHHLRNFYDIFNRDEVISLILINVIDLDDEAMLDRRTITRQVRDGRPGTVGSLEVSGSYFVCSRKMAFDQDSVLLSIPLGMLKVTEGCSCPHSQRVVFASHLEETNISHHKTEVSLYVFPRI